jgi:carbamoyl-phosphate synthase large subunit
MPKRTDISSILVIGAGPIVIGQACEFDYSGTQAIKALKEEGYRIVLVNSNPATIMTDPELADATYVEPITPAIVAKIIENERPDAILPTMGGQTALNTALALFHDGTLEKFGVTMIGADADAIDMAEDRLKFRDAMDRIGLESARSAIAHTVEEALEGLEKTGLPSIIRPSFTMGGSGGGIAYNREEFIAIVRNGLDLSPTTEVLIEESLLGWKEYEMEVVRDRNDNAIIICSIENVDPMGVHTGDSITVAPALTLTDKEYQIMRNASIAVLREIGVETGGSNVQFAVNPKDGRLVVIEMNPRVSRSSALASKATGFPIAKVAAKLAVGYTLGRHARVVRADDRLRRDQDPAVRVREVQGRVEHARHRDEIGRRGYGDRSQHPRIDAEGVARARDGVVGLQSGRSSGWGTSRGNRGCAGRRDAGPVAGRGAGVARGLHGRRSACDRQV